MEALVRQLSEEVSKEPTQAATPAPAAATTTSPVAEAVRALFNELYCIGGKWWFCFEDVLLRLSGDPGQRGAGQPEAAQRSDMRLRAAASVMVAVGKLLWRSEGRLAAVMYDCGSVYNALEHEDCTIMVLCRLCDMCRAGHVEEEDAEGGAGQRQEQQEQEQKQGGPQALAARRTWLRTYGAWRWLPAVACLAQRTAAMGRVQLGANSVAAATWAPLLRCVELLCVRTMKLMADPLARAREAGGEVSRVEEGESEGGSGLGATGHDGGSASSSSSSSKEAVEAASSERQSGVAAASRGGCSVCGYGLLGGCWRDFLLHDLSVVKLLGTALRVLVPELLRIVQQEEERNFEAAKVMLWDIAISVLLTAALHTGEVQQSAWSAPLSTGGAASSPECLGSGGSSSSDGGVSGGSAGPTALWPPASLSALGEFVGSRPGGDLIGPGLVAVADWGRGCILAGRQDPPNDAETAAIAAAAGSCYGNSIGMHGDTSLPPPLCELRALMRVCSNPRCAVLPPLGQAEAEAEAAGRLEACPGGCGVAWYCCAPCREEHGLAGHGERCHVVAPAPEEVQPAKAHAEGV